MENTDPFNPGIYTTTLLVTSVIGATGKVIQQNGYLELILIQDLKKWLGNWYRSVVCLWARWYNKFTYYYSKIVLLSVSTNPIDFTLNVDMTGAVNRYNG
ncbi:MAG: hypothetical protein IPI19_09910 [Ignavibacteriales bacterium]|nr:hypothetical protein [Ignavibacteriales bacterium]